MPLDAISAILIDSLGKSIFNVLFRRRIKRLRPLSLS